MLQNGVAWKTRRAGNWMRSIACRAEPTGSEIAPEAVAPIVPIMPIVPRHITASPIRPVDPLRLDETVLAQQFVGDCRAGLGQRPGRVHALGQGRHRLDR